MKPRLAPNEFMGSTTRLLLLVVILGWPLTTPAGTCSVPGTHPTVQRAVDDRDCNFISVADSTFAESIVIERNLELRGANGGATTIEGSLTVAEPVEVFLSDLIIQSGCPDYTMDVVRSAQVLTATLNVAWQSGLPCPEPDLDRFFRDGFESP